jgi:hypothetical protein
LRSSAEIETRREAAAMTINALPVNNSAPPTITRISPSEKAMPPTSLATPKPRPLPVITSV